MAPWEMKSALALTETKGTLMEQVGDEIMRGLGEVKGGQGYDAQVCKGSFEIITWDLPGFINHEYSREENLQLGSIITITGSGGNAQALTCAEYIRQVWPTTGSETLKVLQEAINKGIGKTHKCKLFLKFKIHRDLCLVLEEVARLELYAFSPAL